MIRKFTDAERQALNNLQVAADGCHDILKGAHVLHAYHNNLELHLLQFEYDDMAQALDRLNKAFEALKPIFPRVAG